jgi:hypothetical protein
MHEGKEKIRSRMIRSASSFWGYNELQPEDSFDPVVGLLIGACAAELEKINRDISETESRLIEKLIEILTPGTITSPFPAHGILQVHPQKPELIIDSSCQFYFTKKGLDKQSGKPEEKQIFFTPAGSHLLLDAKIKYLALQDSLFEYSENDSRELLLESEQNRRLPLNRIWIGIEWKHDLNDLKQVPIYINSKNSYVREILLHLIPRTTWYYQGHKLNSHAGFPHLPGLTENPLRQLENEFDVMKKILMYIKRYYQDHFVTLDFEGMTFPDNLPSTFPVEFGKVFTEKQTGKLSEDVIWIEVHSPVTIEEGVAEDLHVFMNAVPVINCYLNEFTGSTRENINIIPLITDDLFLDLKSVIGKNGETYQSKLFSGMNQLRSGSLLFREGNIGRFDAPQAKEYLEYLLEILKDESAAFNIIGSDLLHADLKELSQVIARFEKKITETEIAKSGNQYFILRPYKGDDLVFVQFWSTNGPQANNLKSGSVMNIYSGKDILSTSLRLLTNTTGGKERPGREERINIYRSALLSKNRIITEEDIKTLCFEHLGGEVSEVTVKKGISEGVSSLQGFIRTIDVTIKLKDTRKLDPETLYEMKKGLLAKLEERSAIVFPYRLFIV